MMACKACEQRRLKLKAAARKLAFALKKPLTVKPYAGKKG